jgi:hypothetical protein
MQMVVQEERLRDFTEKDPRWKLVARIVAAPGFAKSARLSSLLIYIVKQSLEGKDAELNEQLLGERVFGRAIGYDPRDDNIVRAHASRLRQRLEAYFSEEGRAEPLRIAIPRGSYVPQFERVETTLAGEPYAAASSETADEEPILPSTEQRLVSSPIRRIQLAGVILCLLILALVLPVSTLIREARRRVVAQRETPVHKLWSAIFSGNRDTLIVPADSSLVILKVFTRHPVTIAEYASGRYLSDVECERPCDRRVLQTLAEHRYTSLADLKFAVTLTHLPEAVPSRTEIRYARDLQLDDLKQANLILIGSLEADPWLELFERQMNFVLQDDKLKGPLEVENRKPRPGERSEYVYDDQDPSDSGFATVAFLPNLSGTGSVLVVQGFSLAGTQAAAEFVSNGHDFDSLFAPIVGNRQTLPHFEILLRTVEVNGIGSRPAILAYRLYQ